MCGGHRRQRRRSRRASLRRSSRCRRCSSKSGRSRSPRRHGLPRKWQSRWSRACRLQACRGGQTTTLWPLKARQTLQTLLCQIQSLTARTCQVCGSLIEEVPSSTSSGASTTPQKRQLRLVTRKLQQAQQCRCCGRRRSRQLCAVWRRPPSRLGVCCRSAGPLRRRSRCPVRQPGHPAVRTAAGRRLPALPPLVTSPCPAHA